MYNVLRSTVIVRLTFIVLMPFLFLSTLAAQQEMPLWQSTANDFVREILSRSGTPSAVLVSFENMAGSPAADPDTVKRTILDNFQKAGVRLVKPELALAEVQITFSEDWQDHVWVASIRQGPGTQVVIRRFAKLQKATASRAPTLTIRKGLVWQQETPVLDFADDGQNLFVLEPEQIAVYLSDAGKWRLKQTLAISHEHTWPRDLRARLQLNGPQITAYFPGTLCVGSSSPPAMQCRASDDPWLIDLDQLAAFFSPARNFFTGVLAGANAGESVPAFFSAAALPTSDSRQWIFAGTDGRARIYVNSLAAPAAMINDWGSNLASVQSGCGSGRQVLVSLPTDITRSDALQAFEVQNHEALPASSTTELPGPLLALWPGETEQVVHGIVLSAATGRYEAWNFTVGCG
ncbi:MAG TPA: hypothetical protein VNW97_12850 [Candidatus Saccharimonadales bacterium]|nr:hypothetical protein [Candidatus Saccharimonadales bacterium]